MTPLEQLAAWSAEIRSELEQLEAEREPLRAQLADAELRIERCRDAHGELARAVASTTGDVPGEIRFGVALPVYWRLMAARHEMLQEVARLRGGLPARIKSLDELIAGRRLALVQLGRALDAPKPHVREIVGRPRPADVSPFKLAAASQ